MILEALTKEERDKLEDSDFGIPALRKYPLIDAQHVKSAISYFGKCEEKYKLELARNIMKAANFHHVEIGTNTSFYKYISTNKSITKDEMQSLLLREYTIGIQEFVDIPNVARWNSLTDRPVLIYEYQDSMTFFDHTLKNGVDIAKDGKMSSVEKVVDGYDTIYIVNFKAEDAIKYMDNMRKDSINSYIMNDLIKIYHGDETVPFIVSVINYYGYFVNETHAMVICRDSNLIDRLTMVYTRDNHVYNDSRAIKSVDFSMFDDVKEKWELLYNVMDGLDMCPTHLEYIRHIITECIRLYAYSTGDIKVNKSLKLLYDKYVSGAMCIRQSLFVKIYFTAKCNLHKWNSGDFEWFK